jgi:murein DD-endopeptidase MepM/ murein hydrolase activator NlpD
MLGIAFSIGAGSLMVPCFAAAAPATEPAPMQISTPSPVVVQEPLLTSVPQSPVAVVPQAAVAEPALMATPAASATASTISTGHAVKPGETLWQIAQSYKVEVRALAAANNLPTAAVLKVGQLLQLPNALGVTSSTKVISLAAMSQSVPEVPVLGQLAATDQARQTAAVADLRLKPDRLKQSLAELGEESNSATIVFAEGQAEAAAATQPMPGSLPVTRLANVPLPAIGGTEPTMEPTVVSRRAVDVQPTAPVVPQPEAPQTVFNPTPLLAEIHNLRDRYSRQKLATTRTNAVLVAQVLPTENRSRVEPLKAQSVAVNPDFSNRKSDSALSIELRNFVQPKLKPEAADKVKSAPLNAQVVARATLGSEAYAPVTPAVRRMVAPNLPTLGKADAYLPGGAAATGMVWPAQGMLSSGFGWRWGRPHKGIDIAGPTGTPIVAAAAGKVAFAGWNDGGYGYVVEVEHVDGTMTRYAHNDRILVKEGQAVNQGQQLSEMGTTGHSTGPHLHFEVHPRGGEAVNPMAFLGNQS